MATILTPDILNTVGPNVYLAPSAAELYQALADIRLYSASKSVNDISITDIKPIVVNYTGYVAIDLKVNETATAVSLTTTTTGDIATVKSSPMLVDLSANQVQFLLFYNADPKS